MTQQPAPSELTRGIYHLIELAKTQASGAVQFAIHPPAAVEPGVEGAVAGLVLAVVGGHADTLRQIVELATVASPAVRDVVLAELAGARAEVDEALKVNGDTSPEHLVALEWIKAAVDEATSGDMRPTTRLALALQVRAQLMDRVASRILNGTVSKDDAANLQAFAWPHVGWPRERDERRRQIESVVAKRMREPREAITFAGVDELYDDVDAPPPENGGKPAGC
jgi:hypothetical protein